MKWKNPINKLAHAHLHRQIQYLKKQNEKTKDYGYAGGYDGYGGSGGGYGSGGGGGGGNRGAGGLRGGPKGGSIYKLLNQIHTYISVYLQNTIGILKQQKQQQQIQFNE